MHDRRPLLDGDAGAQAPFDLLDRRQIACLRVGPLGRPSLQLALDVRVAPGEVAEPDVVDIDGVQVGEDVDEVERNDAPHVGRDLSRLLGTVDHDPVDEGHHVERCLVHRLVGAEGERRWHRHVGEADGGDEPVLARHVVGGGEHMAERRPPEHEPAAVGVGDLEREVGVTTHDELVGERCRGAVDVLGQPGADPLVVDPPHGCETVPAGSRRGTSGSRTGRSHAQGRAAPIALPMPATRTPRAGLAASTICPPPM